MLESYDYIFTSNATCAETLTAIEAIYAIGVIAMTIDNDVADEEIEGLELFLASTKLTSEERREVRQKIRRLCRESEHGAIFNCAKRALSPSEAETALLLAIKTIQADHKVKAVESGFVVSLAQALNISDERFRVTVASASPDQAEKSATKTNTSPEALADDTSGALIESPALFPSIVHFFKEDNWNMEVITDEQVVRAYFHGENGNWGCYAKATDELHQVVFYSVCPLTVPEEKRSAMAEFIARANDGLIIGNFELNFATGEVRYKTSLDVEGEPLTFNLVKNLVYPNLFTMDRYLPGIIAVIGTSSPIAAIASIEGME